MNHYFRLSTFALLALGITGCAAYTIQPVSAKKLNDQWPRGQADAGYVFYQPELYFLVMPAGAAKDDGTNKNSPFSVSPVFLPNPEKPYRVTTFNFLAKSDFAFNFKDGWQLSSIADKADNTTLANTLSGELKTILTASGFSAQLLAPTPSGESQSFLLHPVYDPDTGVIRDFSIIALPNRLK